MTGLGKPLPDPAIFEKNDGAIAPVTAVGPVWPGAGFCFRPFFRGGASKIGFPGKTEGGLARTRQYTTPYNGQNSSITITPYNVPPSGGPRGPQGGPGGPRGPWGSPLTCSPGDPGLPGCDHRWSIFQSIFGCFFMCPFLPCWGARGPFEVVNLAFWLQKGSQKVS